MNFCTWTLRTTSGCGWVVIASYDTGLTATVPVVDFCDCYTNTADERIVDLQYDVVAQLGLDLSRGLYSVTVAFAEGAPAPAVVREDASSSTSADLPDTAMAPPGGE